jgi:PAS domain S-box-containing protein
LSFRAKRGVVVSQGVADTRIAGVTGFFRYIAQLAVVGALYWVFAKSGLALASINASATPVWPASGLALAAVLIAGPRIAPAIFAAAFLVNLDTAGTAYTSLAIGAGNTLEAIVGAYLIRQFCGRDVFGSSFAVAKFGVICALVSTPLAATIGVATLTGAGLAQFEDFGTVWTTWWLGDLGGAIVVAPPILLWARAERAALAGSELLESFAVYLAAAVVGLIAFSPFAGASVNRGALAFLSILPLMWAALGRGQRDTATTALVLSVFAVWGTMAGTGPFASPATNDAFILLIMFMVSTAIPSLALAADLDARKRTEAELRRARAQLSRRVEQGNEALAVAEQKIATHATHLLEAQRLADFGSWVWDVADGKLIWSDQLFKIYGVRPEDFTGTFDDFVGRVHPDDRDAIKQRIGDAMKSGRTFRLDERIVRPNGAVRHLQSSGEVIRDESGRPIRLLGVCQDVTDARAAAAELEHVREHLAQTQRLEAIAQLTGGVAHDFNNLLMVVAGHAKLLRNRFSDPKIEQSADAILAATRRGENLTRQLVSFAQRQQLSPQPVDLERHIASVRELLAGSLRGDIEMGLDLPAGLWPAEADEAELELALLNIAGNARDAMPDGGTFVVAARNMSLRAPGPGDLMGDFVALTLIDTGKGIAPKDLPHVFEPFFATKSDGKGSGLGLSQVHGFAHQSGGTVTIASEPGQGTTVTLYLRRSRGEPTLAGAPAAGGKAPAQAEGTILVVEDNAEVASVTAALLETVGYRVERAANADQALAALDRTRFDLMFADIVMPGAMNGIQLAEAARRRFPDLPILLTSGYGDPSRTTSNEFRVLRKPFGAEGLQEAVLATIDAHKNRNVGP